MKSALHQVRRLYVAKTMVGEHSNSFHTGNCYNSAYMINCCECIPIYQYTLPIYTTNIHYQYTLPIYKKHLFKNFQKFWSRILNFRLSIYISIKSILIILQTSIHLTLWKRVFIATLCHPMIIICSNNEIFLHFLVILKRMLHN